MFRAKLKEDTIYKIEQFIVTGQKIRNRVTDHLYRIKLAKNTKITEDCPQLADFPFYTYSLKSFDELETRVGDKTYVSDVIGMAVQQTDIIASKNNQDPRRQIRIKNSNDRIAIVTLWGKHAEQFEAEALYQESTEYNMVVLFTGMTVSSFSDITLNYKVSCNITRLIAFGSTSMTPWQFNPSIPEAETLHNNFDGQHYLIERDRHANTGAEASETTLSALGNDNISDIVTKKFKLRILITEVNEPHDWWFSSCKKCLCGMMTQDGKRKCRRCSSSECTPRYKLSVNAVDIESSNEEKTRHRIEQCTRLANAPSAKVPKEQAGPRHLVLHRDSIE